MNIDMVCNVLLDALAECTCNASLFNEIYGAHFFGKHLLLYPSYT
ncbi:hypothetical protein [Serpentinicella alkaliphila]|uniref:Uncharacterized protein n=1 Tax=Serpentinicella alkaliphila TaxID=1734049 RepID=A0A4R2SZ78_9FIRM|nr:hypothetical protein [Serpentinicella alkaliphila]TCP94825.1 hypothetical protein EDD79_10713 [Serpentinicella alkaliphila]